MGTTSCGECKVVVGGQHLSHCSEKGRVDPSPDTKQRLAVLYGALADMEVARKLISDAEELRNSIAAEVERAVRAGHPGQQEEPAEVLALAAWSHVLRARDLLAIVQSRLGWGGQAVVDPSSHPHNWMHYFDSVRRRVQELEAAGLKVNP